MLTSHPIVFPGFSPVMCIINAGFGETLYTIEAVNSEYHGIILTGHILLVIGSPENCRELNKIRFYLILPRRRFLSITGVRVLHDTTTGFNSHE